MSRFSDDFLRVEEGGERECGEVTKELRDAFVIGMAGRALDGVAIFLRKEETAIRAGRFFASQLRGAVPFCGLG